MNPWETLTSLSPYLLSPSMGARADVGEWERARPMVQGCKGVRVSGVRGGEGGNSLGTSRGATGSERSPA